MAMATAAAAQTDPAAGAQEVQAKEGAIDAGTANGSVDGAATMAAAVAAPAIAALPPPPSLPVALPPPLPAAPPMPLPVKPPLALDPTSGHSTTISPLNAVSPEENSGDPWDAQEATAGTVEGSPPGEDNAPGDGDESDGSQQCSGGSTQLERSGMLSSDSNTEDLEARATRVLAAAGGSVKCALRTLAHEMRESSSFWTN